MRQQELNPSTADGNTASNFSEKKETFIDKCILVFRNFLENSE
jgi:hypothetical protein